MKYTIEHIGINSANEEEAIRNAAVFEALFGLDKDEEKNSYFVGPNIEIMKGMARGTHGHIALGTTDVLAAVAELEPKGFKFDRNAIKYGENGSVDGIYFADEICGFAVHFVKTI